MGDRKRRHRVFQVYNQDRGLSEEGLFKKWIRRILP